MEWEIEIGVIINSHTEPNENAVSSRFIVPKMSDSRILTNASNGESMSAEGEQL